MREKIVDFVATYVVEGEILLRLPRSIQPGERVVIYVETPQPWRAPVHRREGAAFDSRVTPERRARHHVADLIRRVASEAGSRVRDERQRQGVTSYDNGGRREEK